MVVAAKIVILSQQFSFFSLQYQNANRLSAKLQTTITIYNKS